MCQKGTDLLSVVLLNRTGGERSSPAAALHTFQQQQLILIDSSPSSSPATVLSSIFLLFYFLTQSRQALYSLLVNIELFCIFQTRKKKKRESFLPPLMYSLKCVYIYCFPICVKGTFADAILFLVCVLPTDRSARVDFYNFRFQPNSLDAQALICCCCCYGTRS